MGNESKNIPKWECMVKIKKEPESAKLKTLRCSKRI